MSLTPEMWPVVLLLLAVLVVGSVIRLNEGWLKDEGKMNSPMSITLKTGDTPADVLSKARSAHRKRLLTYFVLFLAFCGLVAWRDRELAENVLVSLANFLVEILIFLGEILVILADELRQFIVAFG